MIAYVKRMKFMGFDQKKYINEYNKQTYKMFPLRVRKDNTAVIEKLESTRNKNQYIVDLIETNINPTVLTIKQIKDRIRPIMQKHNIHEVYLFGSYSRGEATNKSDVDIYCESGDIKGLIAAGFFKDELESALGKEVDIVFIGSQMHWFFKEQLERDMIKILC